MSREGNYKSVMSRTLAGRETAPGGRTPRNALAPVIAGHPFLQGLGARHLERLTECAMQTQFVPGQLIFSEGDLASRFYLIRDGQVALESRLKGGMVVPIQALGAGDVLGWSWLFPPYYWHFDARATEPTRAIFFHGTRLRAECEADHDFGYELIKRLAAVAIRRMQAAREHLLALHRRDRSGARN